MDQGVQHFECTLSLWDLAGFTPAPNLLKFIILHIWPGFFVCFLCGHRVNHAATLANILEGAQHRPASTAGKLKAPTAAR